MKKLVLTAVLSTLFTAQAFAADTDEGGHFNRVEAKYVDVSDYDADVYGLSFKKSFDSFYVTADYLRHDNDLAELDQFFVGVGYKHEFSNQVTGFADINYAKADAGSSYDESGYSVQAGAIYELNKNVEFSALVRHADVEVDAQEFELGARYYVNDSFSLSATYLDGFESITAETWMIGASYHF
jgi:opacity protein-like surface antigen